MRHLLTVTLASMILSVPALAGSPQGKTFGIGIGSGGGVNGVGNSGLSLKKHTGGTALQALIGIDNNSLGLGLDFLLEQPDFAGGDPISLGWNYGLGATVAVADEYLGAGVAGIVGLEFLLQPIPIELVLEYRPGLRVVPNIDLDLVNFTGHLRFYF